MNDRTSTLKQQQPFPRFQLCGCSVAQALSRVPVRLRAGLGSVLTVHISILSCGGDPFALNLDVLSAGATVQLVNPDLSAAELVRHCALRPHILVKIRRRVILPLFM